MSLFLLLKNRSLKKRPGFGCVDNPAAELQILGRLSSILLF